MSCPTCSGEDGYSRITDAEMKEVMKNAVSKVSVFSGYVTTTSRSTSGRFDSDPATRRNG